MKRLVVLASLLWAVPMAAFAEDKLPPWFPTQGIFSVNPAQLTVENFGRATFRVGSEDDPQEVEATGHHWQASLYPVGPSNAWTWSGVQKWNQVRPLLEKEGWKTVYAKVEGGVRATMQRGQGNQAAFLQLNLTEDDPYSNSVEIIDPAQSQLAVTLKPPAATPENVGEREDFPFVTPLPGAKLEGTDTLAQPLDVSAAQDAEPRLVGSVQVVKRYNGPEHLSNLEFVQTYGKALTQAGWKVVRSEASPSSTSGIIVAQYNRNGRDLWLELSSGGSSWSARVADNGTGMKRALEKSCKVAIYGVNFDFNKATLRKDAEPVLQQVLGLFKADSSLSGEIGGHTDNVGQREYNLKLSQSRAEAVKAWLVHHGVAATRLSARGYGDTVPVVANDSDVNRARNRRVELKKSGCP